VTNLIQKKRELIGKRVSELREKLGLSQPQFARGCGLSIGTIVTIESGQQGYIIDSLLAIVYFLGMDLEQVVDATFIIPSRQLLQERLVAFHELNHSKKYQVLFEKQRLSNVLKERLLNTDFLKEPKEIKEIINFCKDEYKVEFESSSVSNAMKSLELKKLVKIIRPKHGHNNLYKKVFKIK
jgi:transcriptional regulator with XRE-family HTH domain